MTAWVKVLLVYMKYTLVCRKQSSKISEEIQVIYNCNNKNAYYKRARSLVISNLRSASKFFGSSPDATYVQMFALCSNCPVNVEVSVKQVEMVVKS